MNIENETLEIVLEEHKIHPSPKRVKILSLILLNAQQPFTISEIDTLAKTEDPASSISSVVDTLKLFKNTGLIKEVNNIEDLKGRRGRAKIKYSLL